jgi:hypothetical protein
VKGRAGGGGRGCGGTVEQWSVAAGRTQSRRRRAGGKLAPVVYWASFCRGWGECPAKQKGMMAGFHRIPAPSFGYSFSRKLN